MEASKALDALYEVTRQVSLDAQSHENLKTLRDTVAEALNVRAEPDTHEPDPEN